MQCVFFFCVGCEIGAKILVFTESKREGDLIIPLFSVENDDFFFYNVSIS